MKFKLRANYQPIPEQAKAIQNLVDNFTGHQKYQVLLGVTGSGKTFTMAKVIEKLQLPTLIISHNKTLAGQLYQEFRHYFPRNKVSYFVSYYDYYQPEAYIPSTDTYIEKDADINQLIDKLRLGATANLLTRPDTIIIASVSCIYNLGSPNQYGKFIFEITPGMAISRDQIIYRLLDLQYERSDFGFHRGTFRVRGNYLDIYPAYQDEAVRLELSPKAITKVELINPITGTEIKSPNHKNFILYPAKHFITDLNQNSTVFSQIKDDLSKRVDFFSNHQQLIEANRIQQKVTYDLEMIREVGYVKGIENYARYFDGRKPGEAPFSLLDYYNFKYGQNWLCLVDESHISFPQIRGMYHGDLSRKQTLIDYGFRLPAALDNRPLTFEEFMRKIPNFIATSATPGEWEKQMASKKGIVEQLLRPTGITDPEVSIRPTSNQVQNVISEITIQVAKKQRSLITTLTKKTAEDLSAYLKDRGFKVHYLHSDVKTLDRSDTLDDLRSGKYDVLVGINLLREGLDLPEVSLVAILDADKEGFLRSDVTLIQTMGRAARHVEGRVILYADRITGSMARALAEVKRRRNYQLAINAKYGIIPKSITKPIREKLVDQDYMIETKTLLNQFAQESLTPFDKKQLIKQLHQEMQRAARDMNFELAIEIRDTIKQLK